jgi:hypothetical protein
MKEHEQTFKNISALNQFYLKKLKEISKDGVLYSVGSGINDELEFTEATTQCFVELMSQTFGIMLSQYDGDLGTAKMMLKDITLNIQNRIIKVYVDKGSYKDQVKIMRGEK